MSFIKDVEDMVCLKKSVTLENGRITFCCFECAREFWAKKGTH